MSLKLITAPSEEPVSVAEAKKHLRVDHSYDDAMIELYLKAARQHIDGKDGWLGRALVTQTWEFTLDAFPTNEIRIPIPPLQSVTSIVYDNVDGDEETMSSDLYTVDNRNEPGWVFSDSWPSTFAGINAVRVRFVAGYGAASAVPEAIKAAILLLVGSLYDNRNEVVIGQTAVILPFASKALLLPYQNFTH